MQKAVVITPGVKGSIECRQVRKPKISDIPNGRGVLVKVLEVGLDGTDREIIEAEYGESPVDDDFLIIGHESFGIVVNVGEQVTEFKKGDFVSATVRRPGMSVYDKIGMYDFTTDDIYRERGINLLHGYLTEYFVEEPEYLVKVPKGLKQVGVLLEPISIVEKGIYQAFEAQERLKVWDPKRAAVLGAGPLGLLAALILRLRGLDVCVFARSKPPNLNSTLVQEIEGTFLSTKQTSLEEATKTHGPFDIIFEATGFSPLVFEAMKVLAKNGILILTSVTGGDRKVEVEADEINLNFVLGNKLCFGTVNANKFHFELGVKDLSQAVLQYPGWLEKLLTHPINGFDCEKIYDLLSTRKKDTIKIYCKVNKES
ncbi:MAG: glucose 1-dehydrogenase [Candidatus Hodarchaeales archaeon]|jgi:threonine dehydrogenase-like Zn-dependent dehydrogenase